MVVETHNLRACELIAKEEGTDFWQHHTELILKKTGESCLKSECIKPVGLGLDVIMVSKCRTGE
ncbi:hypothetical protein J4209_04470 [Candidatus Woesearchaeota archaeon]|nr:hypothetical protein [Candidatus Woesearchaeota archaeon]